MQVQALQELWIPGPTRVCRVTVLKADQSTAQRAFSSTAGSARAYPAG